VPTSTWAKTTCSARPRKTIISWNGNCYVHHRSLPESILAVKRTNPDLKVLCTRNAAPTSSRLPMRRLSTSGMVRYARGKQRTEFLIVTECGLSDLLLLEVPRRKFLQACKLCQFMKMITLDGTLQALEAMEHEIVLDESGPRRSGASLRRMFELTD